MAHTLEIRWHGRGGLGAKTAALVFGQALIEEGLNVQAIPEFGPERRGAPVKAYNRISDRPIRRHSGITNPDMVVVLDARLLSSPDTLEGLKPGGSIIVNTPLSPEELKSKLGIRDHKVYTVDATRIARDILGMNIPNTPMLAVLAKVTRAVPLERFLENARKRLGKKYSAEVTERNLRAMERACEEVRSA